jgi:hypothetical protein
MELYCVSGCTFEGISFALHCERILAQSTQQRPTLFVIIYEDGHFGTFLFCGVFLTNYFQLPVIDGFASILIG